MFKIICFFLPELFAIQGDDKKKDIKFQIVKYLKYVLVVNFLMMIFLVLTHREDYFLIEQPYSAHFAMKYIAIATIISLVLPTFERVIKDNLKMYIRLEPKQDGKKVKKKKDN